jgi:hypothetical protein
LTYCSEIHFFFSTSLFELGLMVVKEESTRFFAGPLVADAVISAAVLALQALPPCDLLARFLVR